MNKFSHHLEQLRKVKRKKHHALLHHLHKHHHISRKTLLYIKEYGPKSNVSHVIIKESLKVLLFASVLSSFGGFALEGIKTLFVSLVPLVILLPTLNDMVGDYGTIISSRFSAMLHEEQLQKEWWIDPQLQKLFLQLLIIACCTTLVSTTLAFTISAFTHTLLPWHTILKIFCIAFFDVIMLVSLLFMVSLIAGKHIYDKGEDPNNFLIPLTTAIADFGNMVVLAFLIHVFF